MKPADLKYVRVGVSLLFFVLTTVLFLDLQGAVPPVAAGAITYLQFLPSLVKFIAVGTLAAAGFAVVMVLTLLFGRVYCSSICPLGTLQDFVSAFSRRIGIRTFFQGTAPHNLLRYTILGLTAALLLAGSAAAFQLLDPFSSYGRIAADLLRPLFVVCNNVATAALEQLHLYILYKVQATTTPWQAFMVSALLLGVVLALALTQGRLYCNTVCPVGALLGIVSRRALITVGIDEAHCRGCSLCERVCKAGCIDKKNKTIDVTRCVGCFNCLTVCPSNGVVLGRTKPREAGSAADPGKRDFLMQAVALAFIGVPGIPGKIIVPAKDSTIPVFRTVPVAPPGAGGIRRFTDTCTACHLCVSACPSNVLAPAAFEYGILGIMQPRMDYLQGYCNFECTLCTEVCPSGALLPLAREQKKVTQLGTATFVKDNCIVYTEGTECGACSEHCPTKAVNMVPYKKLRAPDIKNEFCIGCGACEHACPTKPYKAIYVQGNRVHAAARKPETTKIQQQPAPQEDFPF
jgi:ferredoxin